MWAMRWLRQNDQSHNQRMQQISTEGDHLIPARRPDLTIIDKKKKENL